MRLSRRAANRTCRRRKITAKSEYCTTARNGRKPNPEAKQLESSIADEKERLEHAKRKRSSCKPMKHLKAQEYSNPSPIAAE